MAVLPFTSETLHMAATKLFRILLSLPGMRWIIGTIFRSPTICADVFTLDFENPLGLAAGMDKKGMNIRNWECLGFGWIEIGGVTLHSQGGNPKPRMFRSRKHKALVNRMGFNNPGAEAMAAYLSKLKRKGHWPSIPVGINIGKSKMTANADAELDYAETLQHLWDFADVFIVNVSSPNTPNLCELQAGSELDRILTACNEVNHNLSKQVSSPPKPLLVKVSPDLADDQIKILVDTAMMHGCSGIVATNTTISRPSTDKFMEIEGGLSGEPLRDRSTEVVHLIYRHAEGNIPIVGVGGISDAESAWEKIAAGASLLQVYSALVFVGPSVVKRINKGISQKLAANGYQELSEAVGHAHRR